MIPYPRHRLLLATMVALTACVRPADSGTEDAPRESDAAAVDIARRLAQYATVRLTSDLSQLSPDDREVVRLLIEAMEPMDSVFWKQAFGNPSTVRCCVEDSTLWRYFEINYGPWDRLAGDEPFLVGYGPKPPGANLYPADITKEEFEAAVDAAPDGGGALKSLYTLVRRDADGRLVTVPYREAFRAEHERAAAKLREAAARASDDGLRRYLELRADALLSDDYRASDMAWLDMKDNAVDVVIGPIETYEDQLFGY